MVVKRIFTFILFCSFFISQGLYSVDPVPVSSSIGASDTTDIVPYCPESTSFFGTIWSYITPKKVIATGAVVTIGTWVGLSCYRRYLTNKLDNKLRENGVAIDSVTNSFGQHGQSRSQGQNAISSLLGHQNQALGSLERDVAGFGSSIQSSLDQSNRGLAVILAQDDTRNRVSDLNARLESLERLSRQHYLNLGKLVNESDRDFYQEMKALQHDRRAMVTHLHSKTQAVASTLDSINNNNSSLSGMTDRLLKLAQSSSASSASDARGSQTRSKR